MEQFIAQESKIFGAYITDASFNVGYNSESSTAQISIVFPDDGPLNTEDHEALFPKLGTCIGIKIGELEFAGIFQRYTHKKDMGGYGWDIVLESPAKVLDGVQVILDKFIGNSFPRGLLFGPQVRNVWNPFGYRESYNSMGATGAFGGSGVNSIGFPAMDLLDLMEMFSRGGSYWGDKIIYGETEYELDLTALKNTVEKFPYLRISGPSQSALSIIEEVTDLCLCDFYVSIKPKGGVITENGPIANPVIYIKAIDRSKQPDPDAIKYIIEQLESEGKLAGADHGKELTDNITQRVVIGGPATRYVRSDRFVQVFGKTKSPRPEYVDYIVLNNGARYDLNTIWPELEMRCALHSFDSWMLFHVICKHLENTTGVPHINDSLRPYMDQIFTFININKFVMDRILNGQATPTDLIDSQVNTGSQRIRNMYGEIIQENVMRMYEDVRNAIDTYYGRIYLVSLPTEPGGLAANVKFVRTDAQYYSSWEIADAAWDESFPYQDITFYDGEGQLLSAVEWDFNPELHDYSTLGDNYVVGGPYIASKATPHKDMLYNQLGEAACVAEITHVNVVDKYTTSTNGLFWLLHLMLGVPLDKLKAIYGFGFDVISQSYGLAPARLRPNIIGIPQVSNRLNWGPWWDVKDFSGKAEILFEESLSPKTFGGIDMMNFAGESYARVVNSEIAGVESGYVEVAGYPASNISDRFYQTGPYVTSVNVSMSTSGYKTTYRFNNWTKEFGKLSKYYLDRNAKMRQNTIRYMQEESNKIVREPFAERKPLDHYLGTASYYPNIQGINSISGTNHNGAKINGGVSANNLGHMKEDPENTHVSSMEQIFSPVEIPREKKPKPQNAAFGKPAPSKNTGSFNQNHSSATSEDLDPFFKHREHDFSITSHNENPEDSNLQNKEKNQPETVRVVRPIGLRGPIMLSGWGYGLDGKPMPFNPETKQFPDDVAKNRQLWKTGPIDLRWDEERKVYVSHMDVVEGVLATDITEATSPTEPTTFTMNVYRNRNYNIEENGVPEDGFSEWVPTGEKIIGVNRSKLSASSGSYCQLIRINYEYRPYWVDLEC